VAPRHAGLLAALAAIWGGSYLLIKYGLEDLEPATIVWLRCALAAVVLFAYLRLSRGGADARRALADLRARPLQAAVLGGISVALPFLLITFGELEVPSGLTAVLIAPASLFVAAFAPFIDPSERVAPRAAAGMLLALGGVALLIGVESVHSVGEFLGSMAILGSAACYALGSFVVKGRYRGMPPAATSLLSMIATTIIVAPLALVTAPSRLRAAGDPRRRVLGVVGTALAFVIFYKLIGEIGAGKASLVSYLAPGVALFYGAVFYDEPVTAAGVGGLAMILAGVATRLAVGRASWRHRGAGIMRAWRRGRHAGAGVPIAERGPGWSYRPRRPRAPGTSPASRPTRLDRLILAAFDVLGARRRRPRRLDACSGGARVAHADADRRARSRRVPTGPSGPSRCAISRRSRATRSIRSGAAATWRCRSARRSPWTRRTRWSGSNRPPPGRSRRAGGSPARSSAGPGTARPGRRATRSASATARTTCAGAAISTATSGSTGAIAPRWPAARTSSSGASTSMRTPGTRSP
jgi:drug/metabolite transporter (DMT)-like permease